MDATRLIETARHALTHTRGVGDVVDEAWQAQALAEAVGGHLSLYGPPGARPAALSLCEAAGRACAGLNRRHAGARGAPARASRLSGVHDPAAALAALAALLADTGTALLSVACAAEDEQVYAGCVEAVDAAEESRERAVEALRCCGGSLPADQNA